MDNATVAAVFQDIADLLELKGENSFKIRAYRRAAESIDRLPEDVTQVMHEGKLTAIPGIGDGLARRIQELILTGRSIYYDELRAEFPEGVGRLMEVPGIGPKTAGRLGKELGIGSIDELEQAALDGRIAALPRLGEKVAEKILAGVRASRQRDRRTPIGYAWPIAQDLLRTLGQLPGVKDLSLGGSLRRGRETVGDIDLVGSSESIEASLAAFCRLPLVVSLLAREPQRVNALVRGGVAVELRLCDPACFGNFRQWHTGSKAHLAMLEERAGALGFRLTEEGLADAESGACESFATEEALYGRLELEFIPPELREGAGEIEAAAGGKLPNLVTLGDMRGDLHMHTTWSDGLDSAEALAIAARGRGYQYIAITDHSAGLGVAHGLSIDRVRKQAEEIREVNQRLDGIRLLHGSEVDIKADGSLDLPDELLAELDIVVASVHSAMGQDEEKVTARLLRAIANPNVDIIGHPTCRIVGGREPIKADMEAVLRAAAAGGKAMEINASPSRLDLKDDLVRRAKELGVKIAISTDSHNLDHLDFMPYGVTVARRGWCEARDVLNAWTLDEVLAFLRRN